MTVSFAFYFLASMATGARLNRVTIIVITLFVVEGFGFTNGFRIMTNVFDPFDYLANGLGVGLAYVVDVVSARIIPQDRVTSWVERQFNL